MANHSWLLMSLLSLIVIIVLSPTRTGVQAQSPTKTPIGEPPTKSPLVEGLPTKTPLPTEAVAAYTHADFHATPDSATTTSTPTLRPSATASPTPITRSPVPTPVPPIPAATPVTAAPRYRPRRPPRQQRRRRRQCDLHSRSSRRRQLRSRAVIHPPASLILRCRSSRRR